jgi:putative membrane protein
VLQFRNHGYAADEDGFYIRRGVLSHYLWILPVEKFHVFHATASLFQRRLNLKTLFVDTAGAATFAYPEVIDVPADDADDRFEALYQRFKTLYQSRVEAATGAPDTRLDPDERPRLPENAPVD